MVLTSREGGQLVTDITGIRGRVAASDWHHGSGGRVAASGSDITGIRGRGGQLVTGITAVGGGWQLVALTSRGSGGGGGS